MADYGDGGFEALVVAAEGGERFLRHRFVGGLQVADGAHDLLDFLDGVAVGLERGGIVEQEVVALGVAGFEHGDGGLLGEGGGGSVEADDAVHDPADFEQIVDREEDDGDENEADDREAVAYALSQRGAGSKHLETLADTGAGPSDAKFHSPALPLVVGRNIYGKCT